MPFSNSKENIIMGREKKNMTRKDKPAGGGGCEQRPEFDLFCRGFFFSRKGLMVVTYLEVKRRLTLTTACPESVQSEQEVGHSPQCSLKWERQTDLDFLLFIQPF